MQQVWLGSPVRPAAKAIRNESLPVIAKAGANQAEASCTTCKNCAIVLGLAGDDESGFTRSEIASHLYGDQPLKFRAAYESKRVAR
ncbi:hypothetical protein D3C72_2022030 [compost metagenome]